MKKYHKIVSWFQKEFKYLIIVCLILIIGIFIIHNTSKSCRILKKYELVESKITITKIPDVQYVYFSELKTFEELIMDIGKKESSYNWESQRPGSQYIGWFQFGNLAFEECKKIGLDIDKLCKDNFLKNKELQIVYFKELIKLNKRSLYDIIKKWNMKSFPGIMGTVTESGILMGAHLVGVEQCRLFFETNGRVVPRDGNGVPITTYIQKFSGYNVNYI